MAWDFSTEPEFQEKLDWVERFCREQVEPHELVFPYAVRARDPKLKALVKELQDKVKEQGLWALFLDEDLGGPGFGQLKLGLLNEILGRSRYAPLVFGCQGVSSLNTIFPSIMADTLRSLPPTSSPIRQPLSPPAIQGFNR